MELQRASMNIPFSLKVWTVNCSQWNEANKFLLTTRYQTQNIFFVLNIACADYKINEWVLSNN